MGLECRSRDLAGAAFAFFLGRPRVGGVFSVVFAFEVAFGFGGAFGCGLAFAFGFGASSVFSSTFSCMCCFVRVDELIVAF